MILPISNTERISVESLVKGFTLDAAYQLRMEDEIGSIEVGKLADLVILSADPTAVDPETLDQIKVVETIKEGESIYQADAAKSAASGENGVSSCAESEACFLAATSMMSAAGMIHDHSAHD